LDEKTPLRQRSGVFLLWRFEESIGGRFQFHAEPSASQHSSAQQKPSRAIMALAALGPQVPAA
jgi:hypothetical protein